MTVINRHLTSEFLGSTIDDGCGRPHHVPYIDIVIQPGTIHELPRLTERNGLSGPVLVVSDSRTLKVCGNSVEKVLAESGRQTECFVIPGNAPHADIPTGKSMIKAGHDKGFLVACGAGTVNDLTKYAAAALGVPYVCVPTAPSMNGYPSSIVAITDKGFKTAESAPVAALIAADPDIFTACPHDMVLAGLGDLISKNVSGADWWLSHHVMGDYFCDLPLNMVSNTLPWSEENAVSIGEGNPECVTGLMESLILSGLSMTVAGVSRPSSGTEHLISHMWDMKHMAEGRDLELHGIQTGITTLITARLFEKVLSVEHIDMDRAERSYPAENTLRSSLENFHGERAGPVWLEFQDKLPCRKRLEKIAGTWDTIRTNIAKYAASPSRMEKVLKDAGARTEPREVGIADKELRESILHAREIRNRYTILDLLADIGLLEEFTG